MAEVVQFVSARERELRVLAGQIMDELGAEAGLQLGRLARSPALSNDVSERLLAVTAIIEREQGLTWYFQSNENQGVNQTVPASSGTVA